MLKIKVLALLILALPGLSFAKKTNFGLFTVEIIPIVGYERIQKLVPTPHTKERIVYGARLITGLPLISAEVEYTRGTDNEDFPELRLFTKDETDKVKLGLRSVIRLVGIVYAFGRAGGQAKKNKHTETRNGVTTVTEDPIYVHPYIGAGVRARLGRNVRFEADFTFIFPDTKNFSNYEQQTTAGFAIAFP